MRDKDQPPRRRRIPDTVDGERQPVMVPRNDKILAPIDPARIDRLRTHLEHAKSTILARDGALTPVRPEPVGFAAQVVRAACRLCEGFCCKNGEDDGFISDDVLARVARDAGLDADGAVRLYLERVPESGYRGSCIFHGAAGCTLESALRSDVCNAYFCGGLHAFLSSDEADTPVVVIAGEAGRMRVSPVLTPRADAGVRTGRAPGR